MLAVISVSLIRISQVLVRSDGEDMMAGGRTVALHVAMSARVESPNGAADFILTMSQAYPDTLISRGSKETLEAVVV